MAHRLSILEEKEQQTQYPSFARLPEDLQQRLLRLARSEKAAKTRFIRLNKDESLALDALSGISEDWFMVPCSGYKFGRMVAFDTTKHLAWAM